MLTNFEKLQLVQIYRANGDQRSPDQIMAAVEADAAALVPPADTDAVIGGSSVIMPDGSTVREEIRADGSRVVVE